MQEAISKFVPVSNSSKIRKKPFWMTRKVLKSVRKKHSLWKKWKVNHDDTAYLEYRKQSNTACKAV